MRSRKFLAGAGDVPLLKYQDGVFARFTDYLRLRQHLYGLEQRWPQAPFWQNRLLPSPRAIDDPPAPAREKTTWPEI